MPKLRWYRLTPDRLVFGLLAMEVFLFLSEWRGWFPLNQHKGWTVLAAVAAVGTTLLLLWIWFVISLLFRSRFRYSLRLLLVVAVGIPGGWLATEMLRANRQHRAVAVVEATGGEVQYEIDPMSTWMEDQSPTCLVVLRWLFGNDFFVKPVAAAINSDAGLASLKALSEIESLFINGPKITDTALVNLRGLSQLQRLGSGHSNVTDAGLENIASLHRLCIIYISATKVTDSGLVHLRGLNQLERLYLDADISDAGLAQLPVLPSAEDLDIGGTNVTDAGIPHLARLPNLLYLSIRDTKITDAGLSRLGQFNQLQILNLSRTDITDAGVSHLQALHNLTCLVLIPKPWFVST